jgi:hypothetical protein
MAFAEESRVKRRGNIREPFVVGAVLGVSRFGGGYDEDWIGTAYKQ